jgi:hypothetical protein
VEPAGICSVIWFSMLTKKLKKIPGSHDAGKTVHASDTRFNQKMQQAAKILNLKPHVIGKGTQAKTLYSCGDIEGHRGTDQRTYLLDFARVFPPQVVFQKDGYVFIFIFDDEL